MPLISSMVVSLGRRVNNQRELALTSPGRQQTSQQNFFSAFGEVPGSAQAIEIDPAVLADPSLIAASSTAGAPPGTTRTRRWQRLRRLVINGSRRMAWSDQVRRIIRSPGVVTRTTHPVDEAAYDDLRRQRGRRTR